MNRTLSNLKISSFYDVNHLQQYEKCRQQSVCYRLQPPPPPPRIPELFSIVATCKITSNSSVILTNSRQRSIDSSYFTTVSIIPGILIASVFICLILFLLNSKFRLHYKLKYGHRRTMTDINSVNSSIRETNNSDVTFIKTVNTNGNLGINSNGGDGCASFSSIMPISYGCSTPLTTTTIAYNPYPSLKLTNNSNLSLHTIHNQQYPNADEKSLSNHNSTNVYEEIRPNLIDRHNSCCCCSCTLAYYQQQQCISNHRQLTPHYYTCEPPSSSSTTTTTKTAAASTIVCQTCLIETLHRRHPITSTMNCACHNFFVPIK